MEYCLGGPKCHKVGMGIPIWVQGSFFSSASLIKRSTFFLPLGGYGDSRNGHERVRESEKKKRREGDPFTPHARGKEDLMIRRSAAVAPS